MEELNNKAFVEAIKKMKEDGTKESQSIMLGEMMKSKFLNPTTLKIQPDENGKVTIPQGTKINFYTIMTTDKRRFAMAFTEQSELDKWINANVQAGAPEENFSKNSAIMGFMEYADIILNGESNLDGLVINPYNENIVFYKEQIASLRQQRINKEQTGITKNTFTSEDQVAFRKIFYSEYPKDMVEALVEHMESKEEIHAAWILKMKKNDVESILIVVDFEGDLNIILGELGKVAKGFLNQEMKSLDMVPLNTKLGQAAVAQADIIYERSDSEQKIDK